MSIHVLKRDLNRMSCPMWCATDHDAFVESDLRQHSVTLAVVDTYPAGRRASVDVSVCDNLDDGTRGAPAVYVWADDGMAPAAARELAAGILAAAQLVEQEAGR